MTFHSLPSLLFSQFARSSENGKAVTIADCATHAEFLISANAVCNTHAVVLLGKGENQEDRDLFALNLRLAQVLVVAISKIRWFVFGFKISSTGPTGEKRLFMHPKVTTLSFLCHRVGGRRNRTSFRAQEWDGGGGWFSGNQSGGSKELGPI